MRLDVGHAKSGGGGLNHRTQRRKFFLVRLIRDGRETAADAGHLLGQSHHRHEDAHVVFPRELPQRLQLRVEQVRILQKEADAAQAQERIVFGRQLQKGQRLVPA
jgi:hypothetical protein